MYVFIQLFKKVGKTQFNIPFKKPMIKKSSISKISICLKVDANSINDYFNPHDPVRLDKRQLGQEFKNYLSESISNAGRYTQIDFKVFSSESDNMRFLVDPLIKTIRRHYSVLQKIKENEFYKFKKKNYVLLLISISIVMFCQGGLPLILGQDHRIHSMFSNTIDVFSWVILWKPIERLIFYWNPFLKELSLYKKIQSAKINIVESEEEFISYHLEHNDAA
jgi:hypothetical protein